MDDLALFFRFLLLFLFVKFDHFMRIIDETDGFIVIIQAVFMGAQDIISFLVILKLKIGIFHCQY
jgi:hypothetical protein